MTRTTPIRNACPRSSAWNSSPWTPHRPTRRAFGSAMWGALPAASGLVPLDVVRELLDPPQPAVA